MRPPQGEAIQITQLDVGGLPMFRTQNLANLLVVLLGIGCNASASVLVKLAVSPLRKDVRPGLPGLLLNAPLLAAVILYVSAFVFFAMALGRLPLNVVQPIMTSAAIALVALLSTIIFGEPFPWTTGLGIGLVIIGVWLISSRTF
jgi:small multidrug resistance pump